MLNNVTLMGRLTADPELKYTANETAYTNFTIAVERDYSGKSEEKATDFIDITAWRKSAEFVVKYFRKGQLIAVQGSVQTDTYEDKKGTKRKSVKVVANHLYFAGSNQVDSAASSKKSSYKSKSEKPEEKYDEDGYDKFEDIPEDEDLPF